MRGMMTLFSVLLTLAFVPSQAEAKRYSTPSTGIGESLKFIAETDQVDPNGNPMSLCYFGKGIVLFSAQMTFEVQGYVLAENRCDADSYFELTLQQMIMNKAAGLFPSDLPLVPETPADIKLRNYGFYGLIAFIIGFGFLSKLIGSMGGLQAMTSKRDTRKARYNDETAVHALAAMCYVATCDGDYDQREIKQISQTLSALTGCVYTPKQIIEMLNYTAQDSDAVSAIGADLSENDRHIVMEAAMRIAFADGKVEQVEYDAIARIANLLQVSAQVMRDLVQKIANAGAAQPATA
ncbi:MAG: TerB family tellurite resistance protein [Marivivens sp.]|nr:TerB family tellurite resistance protein [Marivivens sp.]